jgi:uncharacterized membrane protein YbhN (UPF0104 family)
VLLVVGLVVVHGRPVLAALERIAAPRGPLLALALAAEAASFLAYAILARLLLRRDGVDVRIRSLFRLTLAGVAISSSLPAGDAAAAAYWVKALQREGAERGRAATMLVRLTVTTVLALAALTVVAAGLTGAGPLAAARLPILSGAGLAAVLIVVFWSPLARLLRRRFPSLSGPADGHRATLAEGGLVIALIAAVYWLLDCVALGSAMRSLGIAAPVGVVLAAYCLSQLAAALPLLPGGAGTVEAALVVGFGAIGRHGPAVLGGVLLYRLISTWGIVPLGWGAVAVARLGQPAARPAVAARAGPAGDLAPEADPGSTGARGAAHGLRPADPRRTS